MQRHSIEHGLDLGHIGPDISGNRTFRTQLPERSVFKQAAAETFHTVKCVNCGGEIVVRIRSLPEFLRYKKLWAILAALTGAIGFVLAAILPLVYRIPVMLFFGVLTLVFARQAVVYRGVKISKDFSAPPVHELLAPK